MEVVHDCNYCNNAAVQVSKHIQCEDLNLLTQWRSGFLLTIDGPRHISVWG